MIFTLFLLLWLYILFADVIDKSSQLSIVVVNHSVLKLVAFLCQKTKIRKKRE